MFGCDQTVTLTHLHYDGDADRDVSEETTLTGVSWYGQAKMLQRAWPGLMRSNG